MAEFNLIQALTELGVPEATAVDLKTRLKGGDLMNLINVLNVPNIAQSANQANSILSKYGVKINGSQPMSEKHDYLNSLFDSFKTGKSLDETIGEWLKPINETSHGDYRLLAAEGFNYYTQLQDSGEKLIDWLDSNQVEYLTDGKGHFHVKCGDRESTYKVGRAISEIMKKKTVRDSADREETAMSEAKMSKREREAREKLANLKPKNPVVQAMAQRGGGGAHREKEDARKADKYGRNAKHKKDPMSEEIDETVETGPEDLAEGVIGMTPLNPLFRLRELAGMAPTPFAPAGIEDVAVPAVTVTPEADDFSDLDMSDDMELDAPAPSGDAPVDFAPLDAVVAADPSADLASELDAPIPANTSASLASDPLNGGVPGDLPPVSDLAPLGVQQSDAFAQIEDNLNGIQRQLADIRLSEYKTLIKKLQDLTNQVQLMGRDYLGERRKK